MRKTIFVGLLLVLSVTMCSVDIDTSPTSMAIGKQPISIPSGYMEHDPIVITSDGDFEVQGWPGNGTESNPYLIDGFVINGSKSPSEICLKVEDTRSYFTVTNCYFFNAILGIEFINVSNARFENNEIDYVKDGFSLTGSDFSTIQNNTMFGNASHSCYMALILYSCDNGTIANNTIIGSWDYGIYGVNNHNNTISNNIYIFGGGFGIWLWTSSQNLFFNNTCKYNSQGIYIDESSHYNRILNNSLIENGYGMWLEDCSFFTIANNTVRDSTYNGIQLNAGTNSTLTDNEVWYSVQRGIILGAGSEFNTLYRNFLGWNGENADDRGSNNSWDDGVGTGNFWSDYKGTPNYTIQGEAGSVDHYPMKADTTSPTINSLNDRAIQYGYTGYSITWSTYDEHQDLYEVYRDGDLIESDFWYRSSIEVDIDGLEMGEYNYTIIVYDTCWNTATDTVIVTVHDTVDPVIDDAYDFQYEIGATGYDIHWRITEVNPESFVVYRNGTTIDSGSWDGSDIWISVDGLDIGTYNFTLVVYDTSSNSASSTVIVTVLPVDTTSPTTSTTDTTSPTTTPNGTEQFPIVMVISIVGGVCGIIALIIVLIVIKKR